MLLFCCSAVTVADLPLLVAALLIARGMQTPFSDRGSRGLILLAFVAAVGVGGASIWFGSDSYANVGAVATGIVLLFVLRKSELESPA